MSEKPQGKKEKNLPKPYKRKDDAEMGEQGLEAENFVHSKEYDFLMGTLEEMQNQRMWDKLNFGINQTEDFKRVCIELDLIEEIRGSVQRMINAGKAAREREAARNK